MAKSLVAKDGDTNIRLAKDLPHFNWLELKLSRNILPNAKMINTSNPSTPTPLKKHILGHLSSPAEKNKDEDPILPVVLSKPPAQSSCTSPSPYNKWPLKKRVIRPEILLPSETSDTPVSITLIQKPEPPCDSPSAPSFTSKLPSFTLDEDTTQTVRGPIIVTQVMLPPTPPASSAPAQIELQDKPLDLSKPSSSSSAVLTEQSAVTEQHRDVEILSVTTTQIKTRFEARVHPHLNQISRPSPIRPVVQRPHHHHHHHHQHPNHQQYPHHQQNHHQQHHHQHPHQPHPHQQQHHYSGQMLHQPRTSVGHIPVDTCSRSTSSTFRAFHGNHDRRSNMTLTSSTFRPYPCWNGVSAPTTTIRMIDNTIFPPQMLNNPQNSRYFSPHPQQMPAPIVENKKIHLIAPMMPIPSAQASVSGPGNMDPVDWAHRCCVVCSRRAGFRCAGCHGKAYCSTVCQAVDWPKHSQCCQRGS